MNLISHMVEQLINHKPPVMYADTKGKRTCACGETDPAQFYAGKSTCKACRAKSLKEWRATGRRVENQKVCQECGKDYTTHVKNSVTCGPVCRHKRKARMRNENLAAGVLGMVDNAKAVGLDAAGGQSRTSDGLCAGASSEN